ncbi:MAG: hypothetical protein OIN88_15265, partial [Candidatus Methanoperedens sp.]|nr:hypothetical protein [Candidatus Methanoperedens sp.]
MENCLIQANINTRIQGSIIKCGEDGMRGMGFEPTNSYETSPSTLRNIWRKLYYILRQFKGMKHPPRITIDEL